MTSGVQVLRSLLTTGPQTRPEVAAAVGLSKPTVSDAIRRLEAARLVRATGQRHGARGRSPVAYDVSPEAGYVLAVDIGGANLRAMAADLRGTPIATSMRATKPLGGAAVAAQVVDLVCELLDGAALGLSRDPLVRRLHPRRRRPGDRGGQPLLQHRPGRGVRPAITARRAVARADPARQQRELRGPGRAAARTRAGSADVRLHLRRRRHRHGPGVRGQGAAGTARRGRRDRLLPARARPVRPRTSPARSAGGPGGRAGSTRRGRTASWLVRAAAIVGPGAVRAGRVRCRARRRGGRARGRAAGHGGGHGVRGARPASRRARRRDRLEPAPARRGARDRRTGSSPLRRSWSRASSAPRPASTAPPTSPSTRPTANC